MDPAFPYDNLQTKRPLHEARFAAAKLISAVRSSSAFDTAGERLDEIAAGKSEGNHGR
jgi:hypothetical protein